MTALRSDRLLSERLILGRLLTSRFYFQLFSLGDNNWGDCVEKLGVGRTGDKFQQY